ASAAVSALAPPVTPGQLAAAASALAAVGLTGVGGIVSTAGGCWAGPGSELDALISAAPELPIDVGVLVIAHTPDDLTRAAERIGDAGGRLRFLGWKAFSDGSLGGHTAAMHEPFSDRPDTRGTHRLDPAWARDMALASVRLGGRVAIHAIGDAANGAVLDVMEDLIGDGVDPALLRVEHASVLTADDITRFGRLGVTACVQPAFLASETSWLEKRLGPERMSRTYPFRSLLDAGAPIAGSSDCPVEPPHPLWGIAAARDRAGLVPEEALDADEAFALFTTGAATAMGADAGLSPGSPADLVVLDTDPRSAPDELRTARVLATYVDGERVATPDPAAAWIA
ncbi:MAG TPA: amidohydrolase family protein, partial [Acidimicrobiia bacterium]|nr:amidohydrolase family protein [Acidimicrobiia bacterium]